MRDLVGYGRNRPDPLWPDGARIAVNVTITVEEGAEESVPDGFGRSEAPLTDAAPGALAAAELAEMPGRDLTAESLMAYGGRVGFWRLQRLLEERGVPATIAACAVALERNPQIAVHSVFQGYDLLGHGWRHSKQYLLDEQSEREHLSRALASYKTTWGSLPEGWWSRYGPSLATRRILIDNGIAFDSDAADDELPYWTPVGGRKHLVVPGSPVTGDDRFASGAWATADDAFTVWRDAFDTFYAEGERSPGMLLLTLHPRVSGHPSRSPAVARFLDHVLAHDEVWITRRTDIARHWEQNFPAETAR